MMMEFTKRLGGFLRFVSQRFNQDRCLQIAGSLTYTTLLSLVPLFTIVVAMFSALPFFEKAMVNIKVFLLLNLVPEIAYKIITVYMEQFAENAARLTFFGLLALLAMALAMLFTVDKSFNSIWRSQRARPLWMSISAYIALLVLAPLMLGLSMSVTSYLVSLSLGVTGSLPYADEVLLKLLTIAGSTTTLFLVYRIVPCRHVPAQHALIGGLFAAVLFETMKHFFGVYIALAPTYDLVYGAFAAIPIFLLWIFLSWMVILLGAEVTAALAYWKGSSWRRLGLAEAHLHDGLLVMRAFIVAQGDGRVLTLADLKEALPIAIDRLEDILDLLLAQGLIERQPGMQARYRLLKTPDTLSIADIYRLFVLPGESLKGQLGSELAPLIEEIANAIEAGMQRRLSDVFQTPDEAES
jgi:membrane protein